MKKIIISAAILLFITGCNKKETVTETPETTTTVTTENSANTTSEIAKELTHNSSEAKENDDQEVDNSPEKNETKSQEFSGNNRVLKVTWRYDAEGNEAVVLSENSKIDRWLYRKANSDIYAGDNISLTVNNNKLQLTENGKTTTFELK